MSVLKMAVALCLLGVLASPASAGGRSKSAGRERLPVFIFNSNDSESLPTVKVAAPPASQVSQAPILLVTVKASEKSSPGESSEAVEPEDIKLNEQQVMIEDAKGTAPKAKKMKKKPQR